MFELPEIATLANQINSVLQDKEILHGELGNSPHKFIWYNRSHEEFEALTQGRRVGVTHAKAKWLFVPLEPSYLLLLGECGGRILYHPTNATLPAKYHLHLHFADESHLTVMSQMWGAIELYEQGKEMERGYVKGMRPTPVDPTFTWEYFDALVESLYNGKPRSAKALLTQDQLIPGLGNAIAQDILFHARLHPRHPIKQLDQEQRSKLYHAIIKTVCDVTKLGGRYDEVDLFGDSGGYTRLMDSQAVGKPCPICGTTVEKMQYLGGTCYFCPTCQQ